MRVRIYGVCRDGDCGSEYSEMNGVANDSLPQVRIVTICLCREKRVLTIRVKYGKYVLYTRVYKS